MKKVVLIGSGIMSTTMAVMVKKILPDAQIDILEMLPEPSQESSEAMNNAGTGHSGYCELNYTPEVDGVIKIDKATKIAQEFMLSREFWSYLVESGYIKNPQSFIRTCPHYSFVNNEKDKSFLKKRYESLKSQDLFKGMEYSEDPKVISQWVPLLMKGRKPEEPVACTKMDHGTDVDFGNLTRELLESLIKRKEVRLHCNHLVKGFKRRDNGQWALRVENLQIHQERRFIADFVFIGAGGGSLLLLEKTGIPEAAQYGGFPVGGEWLVCENPDVVKKHHAKVYGQAKIGAPPMSVPHLDTRVIKGQEKLLFGPFATFSTKFLKNGSYLDFFKSLQKENLFFISQAGIKNMALTSYLIKQVSQSKHQKIQDLKEYYPEATESDWKEYQAGQRVQLIKKDALKGGTLEFGTEVVVNEDKTLSAMLGASPGASTSAAIILEILNKCFPENKESFETMMPSIGNKDPQEALMDTKKTLKL